MTAGDDANENQVELISQYFKQGYSNMEILEFLKLHHVSISVSTLKRRPRSLGLFRRATVSDDDLKSAMEKKLGKSGCFVEYRKMWARLRKNGIIIKREKVMTCLRELDPDGVESRRKKKLGRRAYHTKGPNFIWHIDDHDKLKPYGFSVYGLLMASQEGLHAANISLMFKQVIYRLHLTAI